ncbi:hypothetical protein PDIDSM_5358 [Penicillium digitatum]|nr:hypothetical protein PDIDSM_5358 [Penicillium digitatum]
MEELAQSAREVLNTMENDGRGGQTAGSGHGKVQQALNRLDQRMIASKKLRRRSSNSNDTVHTNKQFERLGSLLGTAPEMGTRDRLRPPPSLPTSNGSSSIGVSPAELREDREIIVKIRDSDTRETLRRRTPRRSSSRLRGHGSKPPGGKPVPPLVQHMLGSRHGGSSARYRYEDDAVDTGVDAGMAKELVRQNSHSWGDTQVEILHLGWLVKPGKRREGSIIIEFTDPVVANQAITQGTLWQHQVHQTTRFCREGRSKLCLKCQKPGHVHSQCLNEYQCGHCAKQHPTWECAKQGDVEVKCANCGGGHRPTSDACEPSIPSCATPLRQRETTKGSTTTSQSQQGLDTPIHAPQQTAQRTTIYRAAPTSNRTVIASHPTENAPHPTENASHPTKEIRRMYTKVGVEKPQRRKEPSHVMRTRSRTSEDDDLPIIPEELAETASAVSQSARSLRSQNQETMQFMTDPEKQLQTSYKKRRMTAPADDMAEDYVMDEQPERLGDTNWYDTKLLKSTKMRKRSSMMRRSTVMIQEQTPTTPPHLNELLPNNSIQCTQRPSSHGLISVRQSSPESGCDCGSGTLDQLSINNNPLPKQGHPPTSLPEGVGR